MGGRAMSIAALAGVLTLLGSIAGGVVYVEERYDQRQAVRGIEIRLAVNELQQQKRDADSERLFAERQLRKDPGNAERVRKWTREVERIEAEIRDEKKKK